MTDTETDGTERVQMSYFDAAKGYTIGFSCAVFMVTTLLAYVILSQQHVPESVFVTAVPFFVILSILGLLVVGVAYTYPTRFYELLEGVDR